MEKHLENKTEIKAYTLGELARMYTPEVTTGAAVRKLKQWICHHPELPSVLLQAGWKKDIRKFTPKQVIYIFNYLGEP